MGLTELERDRERRIAENKRRMAALLGDVETDFHLLKPQVNKAPTAKPKAKPMPRPMVAEADKRRSNRIKQMPAPQYNIELADRTLRAQITAADRTPKRAAVRPGTPSALRRGRAAGGWCSEMGDCSLQAAEAATEAAIKLARELEGRGVAAAVKLMSASQVSGGFWMQLPNGLVRQFLHKSKVDVELVCSTVPVMADGTTPEFRYNKDDARPGVWYAVYLPRDSSGESAGLSGGWRGFAIDQVLFPSDAVVFEKEDSRTIRVHVFRGADHETEETAPNAMPATVLSIKGIPTTMAARALAAGGSGSGSVDEEEGGDGPSGSVGQESSAGGEPDATGCSNASEAEGTDAEGGDVSGGGKEEQEEEAASPSLGGGMDTTAARRADQGRRKRAAPEAPAADDGEGRDNGAAAQGDQERPTTAAGGAPKRQKRRASQGVGAEEEEECVAGAGGDRVQGAAGYPSATAEEQEEADRAWEAGDEVRVPTPKPMPKMTAAEHKRNAESDKFWVKRIVGYRRVGRQRQFLIRWWYFSATWDSWEPRAMLDAPLPPMSGACPCPKR